MEDKTSIVKFLGWPEPFAVVLLTFSFVLLLAPYFSGADFGLFKIPKFSDHARKQLKIIGPIVFLVLFILFLPLIRRAPPTSTNRSDTDDKRNDSISARAKSNNNLSTPSETHDQVQRHLARAQDLYGRAQYDEAIKECDNALDLEPENQDALTLKSSIKETKKILNRNQ